MVGRFVTIWCNDCGFVGEVIEYNEEYGVRIHRSENNLVDDNPFFYWDEITRIEFHGN